MSGGTSSGSYSGPTHGATYSPGGGWGGTVGHATLSGQSSTVLARRLAAPSEPPTSGWGPIGPVTVVLIALRVLLLPAIPCVAVLAVGFSIALRNY